MPGGSNTTSARVSPVQSDVEEDERLKFRVCMMGESQVGKTSLVSQCLTSDYMNTYDASLGEADDRDADTDELLADDEYGEKSVCVALDGQEAELTFIDHPSSEMSVRDAVPKKNGKNSDIVFLIVLKE